MIRSAGHTLRKTHSLVALLVRFAFGERVLSGSPDRTLINDAERLIDGVVRRISTAEYFAAWFRANCVLGGVAIGALFLQRCFGFGRELIALELVFGLPLVAALIAIIVARKPTSLEAARRIDDRCGASDLFLTLAQLESSAGAYQPVIAEQAGVKAAALRPSTIVPWRWQRPLARLAVGVAVFVATVLFLPQFDPFGTVDSASAAVAVRRDLQTSRRETENRQAELSARHDSAQSSSDFNRSLAELAAGLRQLTTERSDSNIKDLDVRQREIEARWREARTGDEVSRVLEQAQATQFFGASDQRSRQWVEELADGQTQSIDEAFDSLGSDLEKLDSVSDDAERQQLEKQIRQAMAELQRFAGNQLQSQPIEAAMKRAMSQLDASRLDSGLQAESAEAAKDSLELAQAELHEIANDAAQLASLEQALNAIQSAKQLAQDGTTQPSDSTGRNEATIQEFVEQYADLQGEAGQSQLGNDPPPSAEGQEGPPGQQVASSGGQSDSDSPGKAGSTKPDSKANGSAGNSSGHGSGRSAARENQSAESRFRDSREAASLDATRRLMAMRRQGLSDTGEASQEYREFVRSLQKRVSTAIEVEEIPPGYVSGIRSYFDSLDQAPTAAGTAQGEAEEASASVPADDSDEATDATP
ncbi:MAG: hypothetical protein ACI93T_002171 [Porticoccaceae bacterium]